MIDALDTAVAAYSVATTANQKRGRWTVATTLAMEARDEGQRLAETARRMDAWLDTHPSTRNERKLIAVLDGCGAIHAALKDAEGVLA